MKVTHPGVTQLGSELTAQPWWNVRSAHKPFRKLAVTLCFLDKRGAAGFVTELTTRLARDRKAQTILLVDLDRFKLVNDTLGHHAGDDLVRKICSAMAAVLPAGGVLARPGGDEFGIVLEATSEQGVNDFCNQILRVCSQTRRVAGHEVQISASIGVARQDASRSEVSLMRRADLALSAGRRNRADKGCGQKFFCFRRILLPSANV